MRREATFTLTLTITDVGALFDAAWDQCIERGIGEEETRKYLMNGNDVDIGSCITELFDPGMSPPGTQIQDSSTEVY